MFQKATHKNYGGGFMKHGEARFLSCMYVLSLSLLMLFAFNGLRETAAVSAIETVHPVVILDAGHGGADGGASGTDGTKESTLNLEITLKTDAVLGLLGEKTILVREMDTDLSSEDAASISQKKVSDIRNRVALANENPDGILVSIHCNTYSESKYRGAQVFYNSQSDSKLLAQNLQDSIRLNVDSTNLRQPKQISPSVYLMKHVDIPGVLVECGFLTNPEELSNLKSQDYQKQLAVSIAVTISNYLTEEHSDV